MSTANNCPNMLSGPVQWRLSLSRVSSVLAQLDNIALPHLRNVRIATLLIMALLALGLAGCSRTEPTVNGEWSLSGSQWSPGWLSKLELVESGGIISGNYVCEVKAGLDTREIQIFKVSGIRVHKDVELKWSEKVNSSGIKSLNYTLKGTVDNNKMMSGRFEGKFDFEPELMMLQLKYRAPIQGNDGLWVARR